MKLHIKIFVLILLWIQNIQADNNYTFGLGSSTYSWLGTNIGLVSDTDMKYLSTGLKGYQSYSGFQYSIGIGWITTSLISSDSNNHGIGIYLGLVDQEYYTVKENNVYVQKSQNVYGVTYNYFFNGINKPGANLGLSLINYNYYYENKVGLSLEIGYQF